MGALSESSFDSSSSTMGSIDQQAAKDLEEALEGLITTKSKGVELNNKLPCVKALNLSSASSSSSGNGGTKRPRLQSRTTFKKVNQLFQSQSQSFSFPSPRRVFTPPEAPAWNNQQLAGFSPPLTSTPNDDDDRAQPLEQPNDGDDRAQPFEKKNDEHRAQLLELTNTEDHTQPLNQTNECVKPGATKSPPSASQSGTSSNTGRYRASVSSSSPGSQVLLGQRTPTNLPAAPRPSNSPDNALLESRDKPVEARASGSLDSVDSRRTLGVSRRASGDTRGLGAHSGSRISPPNQNFRIPKMKVNKGKLKPQNCSPDVANRQISSSSVRNKGNEWDTAVDRHTHSLRENTPGGIGRPRQGMHGAGDSVWSSLGQTGNSAEGGTWDSARNSQQKNQQPRAILRDAGEAAVPAESSQTYLSRYLEFLNPKVHRDKTVVGSRKATSPVATDSGVHTVQLQVQTFPVDRIEAEGFDDSESESGLQIDRVYSLILQAQDDQRPAVDPRPPPRPPAVDPRPPPRPPAVDPPDGAGRKKSIPQNASSEPSVTEPPMEEEEPDMDVEDGVENDSLRFTALNKKKDSHKSPVTLKSIKARRKKAPKNLSALQDIQRLQNSTKLLLPKASFQRVVKEVVQEFSAHYRIQSAALAALQEASESYLVGVLEDANLAARHAKRVTLKKQDLILAKKIRQYDLL